MVAILGFNIPIWSQCVGFVNGGYIRVQYNYRQERMDRGSVVDGSYIRVQCNWRAWIVLERLVVDGGYIRVQHITDRTVGCIWWLY